jgi:hypothetical protein
VRAWWNLALPVVGTKPWVDTWADFRRAWFRAAVPVSESRAVLVMAAAAAGAGDDPPARLATACRAMAAGSADGTFHLSCRLAGRVAGVEKTRAAELLRRLVESATLAVVESGTRGSRARRATVYRLGRVATAAA